MKAAMAILRTNLLCAAFTFTLAFQCPPSSSSRVASPSLANCKSFGRGVIGRSDGLFGARSVLDRSSFQRQESKRNVCKRGWLDGMFPTAENDDDAQDRRAAFPEQYEAIVDDFADPLAGDGYEAALVRPLLIGTQLERRQLQLVFSASRDGWSAAAFHRAVDGLGAGVVICETEDGAIVGGYNPMGWAGMGGARPSVAAFLFAWSPTVAECTGPTAIKLRKVGGGGLACGNDDPNGGIWFGPDGLVVDFTPGQERAARSKLGTYFERGPDGMASLLGEGVWREGGPVQLRDVRIIVGVYDPGEEIPNAGAVFDMTSG